VKSALRSKTAEANDQHPSRFILLLLFLKIMNRMHFAALKGIPKLNFDSR
jgi:hypothetical protein